MSDGGRDRASLGVEVWKSSQKWNAQRAAVRSIAWLDARVVNSLTMIHDKRYDGDGNAKRRQNDASKGQSVQRGSKLIR
jgi:hypothetical protein